MKYIETYEKFHQELPNMTEIGSRESGDDRHVYHDIAYIHNETGELWIEVIREGVCGGGALYERHDKQQEIREILKHFK